MLSGATQHVKTDVNHETIRTSADRYEPRVKSGQTEGHLTNPGPRHCWGPRRTMGETEALEAIHGSTLGLVRLFRILVKKTAVSSVWGRVQQCPHMTLQRASGI